MEQLDGNIYSETSGEKITIFQKDDSGNFINLGWLKLPTIEPILNDTEPLRVLVKLELHSTGRLDANLSLNLPAEGFLELADRLRSLSDQQK